MSALMQSGKVKMCLISFKTLTASLRAASVLKSAGIDSRVVSIDPNLTKNGCSYGVSVSQTDRETVISVLRRNRLQFGQVFGG